MKINHSDDIVIAGILRTPIGQVNKSLSRYLSYQLGEMVAKELLNRTGIDKNKIESVVTAEIGQSSKAPNVARVISVLLGLPLEIPALTVANNCVSSFEAVAEAIRRVLLNEQEVNLVIGTESMSNYPIYLDNARRNSKTATPEKIMQNLDKLPELEAEGIKFIDAVFEGLTDPATGIMMIETGEIAAQNYNLSKDDLDDFAYQSYKNAYEALEAGKYDNYIMKMEIDGKTFDKDEYIMSKKGFAQKRERFAKASPIYEEPYYKGGMKAFYENFGQYINKPYSDDVKGGVTLFNACPQSDGAGALILTTRKKAEELGLPIQAKIVSYAMKGVHPAHMGIGMAYAAEQALKDAGLQESDIAKFEIHEAFAATAMGTIKEMTDKLGINMMARYEKGDINPNGGTLALGHPLGATGIRVLINMIMDLDQNPDARYVQGAICAGGGVAGSFIIERP